MKRKSSLTSTLEYLRQKLRVMDRCKSGYNMNESKKGINIKTRDLYLRSFSLFDRTENIKLRRMMLFEKQTEYVSYMLLKKNKLSIALYSLHLTII